MLPLFCDQNTLFFPTLSLFQANMAKILLCPQALLVCQMQCMTVGEKTVGREFSHHVYLGKSSTHRIWPISIAHDKINGNAGNHFRSL